MLKKLHINPLSQLNPLSQRLVFAMVGLFGTAGLLVLLFNLPGFHQKEVERRMHELTYMTNLHFFQIELGQELTPIDPGYAVGFDIPSEQILWFGDPQAQAAVSGNQPHIWPVS